MIYITDLHAFFHDEMQHHQEEKPNYEKQAMILFDKIEEGKLKGLTTIQLEFNSDLLGLLSGFLLAGFIDEFTSNLEMISIKITPYPSVLEPK
jgi:hypothetical protein